MIRSVSRSVLIAAPAATVFSLLSDARRHADFDGSGTVKGSVRAPETLSLGARFGMRMRLGIPYSITNEVVEFEQDRRIAWRHLGHHVWRYDLAAVEGGTEVTETFDWSSARSPRALELAGYPTKNAAAIEATLERLKELVEKG